MYEVYLVGCALALFLNAAQARPQNQAGREASRYVITTYSDGGERGQEGYESKHEREKGASGSQDKENRKERYGDEVGQKSGHRHQDGYHDVGYADRIGQHGYHYHDKGSYAKGHCTKGTHDVHKLEELNKTKEFFDEDRGEDNHEKHGAYEIARGLGNGAFRLEGRAKKVSLADELLKSWKSDLGSHGAVDSGYGRRKGTEENFKNAEKSAERNGFDVYELVGDSWKNEAN